MFENHKKVSLCYIARKVKYIYVKDFDIFIAKNSKETFLDLSTQCAKRIEMLHFGAKILILRECKIKSWTKWIKLDKIEKKDRIENFIKTQRLVIIEKLSFNIARKANYIYIRNLLSDTVFENHKKSHFATKEI